MTILFQPAPTGTTHFIRYASGHVVWCKIEQGDNNQLTLKEWDSFNQFWVTGIHTVEHYQSAGLNSIDDFPTEPASPVTESAPAGATHCYHHAGEVSWYRKTADNLFVWRDGSWYASVYKTALELANTCPLGTVSTFGEEKQPEQAEDDLTWLARNVHVWPASIIDGVFRGDIFWIEPNGEIKAAMANNPLHCYTRDQWLARRAELQNKPSWAEVPAEAEHMTQDSNGAWGCWSDKPAPVKEKNGSGDTVEYWGGNNPLSSFNMENKMIGEVLGDWRDTLERRPADMSEPAPVKMMDKAIIEKFMGYARNMPVSLSTVLSSDELHDLHHLCDAELTKRDAVVCGGQKCLDAHWFERCELPPVGTECEFCGGAGDDDDPWHPDLMDGDRVTVIAHFECGICTVAAFTFKSRNPNIATVLVEQANYACFRPIRTERDELMDAIVSQGFLNRDWGVCGQIADAILSAGFKRGGV